ncbi:MAG TPA: gfo/Idh/MocA family oxidoreductase [Propionibacteriaceae bacterium]|nr:gfo/Idh/MocA family oxidoreductase [Propionibacteriaceae bacterium]
MQVRVGIVGAGHMGQTHAAILKEDARVEIVGVADFVATKAEALAVDIGTRPFHDVDQLLNAGIDAIYVATPNTRHVEVVLRALEQGIHVFSEKPMATSLDGARQIRDTARVSKAVYQVGHNRRFAPVYTALKRSIAEGLTPYLTNAKQNDGDWFNPPWITDLSLTGGFLYESSVHVLDVLCWLLGEPVSVQARAKANVYDVLNDFAILITFEGDRFAVFSSSAHASWGYPFEQVEIVGDHAFVRSEELDRVVHSPGLEREINIVDYRHLPHAVKWGYQAEDALFIGACLGKNPPAVDVEAAYKSIELCEACYLSAANGAAQITLPL